ncbi:MAG: putative mercuric transport protein [Bacillota bacterium]
MKEKILGVGSIIVSFLASICCVGIPLLSILGLSGLGLTFVPIISPYKNIFMLLTALMLGMAYYFMAKNKNTSKSTRIILWTSTIISVGFITYSYLLER